MSKIEKAIIDIIKTSVKKIFPDCAEGILPNIYLEIPKEKRFGDLSTNVAMRLTRGLKKPPREIASIIVEEIKSAASRLKLEDVIRDIRIESPGFINFYLSNNTIIECLCEILKVKYRFGNLDFGKGKKVQIEFVSANPTGPLTIAHGRQAAVGDSLARILGVCGYKVSREYYINDEGVQMALLGESIKARFMELNGEKSTFPENGYKGDYIYEIADQIKQGLRTKKKKGLTREFFIKHAYNSIMRSIKKDLTDFNVKFDIWYSQKKLSRSGRIEKALDLLRDKGFLYEKDGATWFRSTHFNDDKDRVVVKSQGDYTYLAPDIAYHQEKFERGYDRVIDIWGPDHHGYVNRLKAACQALGYSKDRLSILISQLVTLYRNKKPVRMSTRQGEFIALRQVMDEVGRDACRFFFIMRRTDSHLDFDIELAKAKTMDNPVYYIQYAHARMASVMKFSGNIKPDLKNLYLLDKPVEIDIVKILMQYPKIIEASARNLEPYILLSYLQDLASAFHSYYDAHRIVTDDTALTKARISLIKVVKAVIFGGLTLLGVTAPEKM